MLSIDNLKVSYGQSNVIKGVSFDAKPGETIAIMGRNGMGKTTLMKSMIGILKSDAGSVKLGDEELAHRDSFRRVRSGMSFVPQGRQIFSTLSVEQNIKTGLEARKGAKNT